ncbi:Put_Phosphatase domain-containing protein [Cephalotus follicularis]|uniref:Put_Phosphatase domain-containing protein n=1 Tax=Cephalotus follicularis TaxID=3775 RepID=A0A1Q3BKE0_CEPFO|nr:Put_Phosphatase domain-containing protein [Cephalotus follicularis]
MVHSSPPAVKMAGKIVVLFDFDRTLIDGDSDGWVVAEMGLTPLFNRLCSSLPWNSLMDRMMEELYSQGKTAEDITECLKRVPVNPRIIAAIKSANTLGCDLKIVSDANQFFIETIMENHGLLGCFSEIITNPSFIDQVGRLRIFPYHKSSSSPHNCQMCPSNLCKGLVLEHIRASNPECGRQRFIYLGDGKNDFCPSSKLGDGDCVMPRKNYPLWNHVCSNPTLIKAEVLEWSKGGDLERILLQLINTISNEGKIVVSNSILSNPSDSKSQTIPASAHELCPHTHPVQN